MALITTIKENGKIEQSIEDELLDIDHIPTSFDDECQRFSKNSGPILCRDMNM